jgi:RNA polymerase sigma-70 factor (ECF subfamily)
MPQPVDARAIAELFDRHAGALTLYARQWTTAPDDCVQEAFIELARQSEAPASPAAWLYRVTRNRALNALRSARRRTTHEQAVALARDELNLKTVSPDERLQAAELLLALEAGQREIVVLRVWGGLSWQEIAELVGASKSSAQRTYVQALEQLRRLGEPNHV